MIDKMLLNWDMVISDMTVYGYGKQRNDYIYDVYRGGIEWQLKDAINGKTKHAVRSHEPELLIDRYTICNDKNDKIIHLSKMIKDYCENHFIVNVILKILIRKKYQIMIANAMIFQVIH